MSDRFDWSEYKLLEYLGDGLYNFLIREILFANGFDREKKAICFYIQRNDFQAAVAIKMGLKPPLDVMDRLDIYGNNSPYPFSDHFEVHLYKIFQSGGYESAKIFVLEKVMPFCISIKLANEFTKSMVIPKIKELYPELNTKS